MDSLLLANSVLIKVKSGFQKINKTWEAKILFSGSPAAKRTFQEAATLREEDGAGVFLLKVKEAGIGVLLTSQILQEL